MDVPELVATYGYPLIVVGALVEGEAVLIAAGYLAHRHHLEVWKVVACAAAGGVIGDQAFFQLGRAYGEKLIDRLPRRMRARAARARALVQRHPVRILVAMRFVYGMRIVLPILCGASTIPLWRYIRYNVATAIVWATLLTAIGYAFGAAAEAFLKEVARYEGALAVALVATILLIHFGSAWLRDRVASRDAAP